MLAPALLLAFAPVPGALPSDQAEKLAGIYAKEIDKLNADHARKPRGSEEELAAKLPAKATKALAKLLAMDVSDEVFDALLAAGEAALELDRLEDFALVRERLGDAPAHASKLGVAITKERFQLRGLGGLDEDYLETARDASEHEAQEARQGSVRPKQLAGLGVR